MTMPLTMEGRHALGFAPQGFGDAPVGSVLAFAGQLGTPVPATATPPVPAVTSPPPITEPLEAWGWMFCDGRSLNTNLYSELFAALGYLYGPAGASGDTFCIPDYRGYFLRCVTAGTENDPDAATRTPAPGGTVTGVGSSQSFALQTHEHSYLYAATSTTPTPGGQAAGAPLGQPQNTGVPVTTSSPPGLVAVQVSQYETRPSNIYVNYIIKFTSGLRRTMW